MLTSDQLGEVLIAVVGGRREEALGLIRGVTELTDDVRSDLMRALSANVPAERAARSLGDALRSWAAPRDLVNECYRAAFYAGDEASRLAANPLFALFLAARGGRVVDTWPHYFDIYDRHLSHWRGTDVRVLEIGTGRGGRLDLLRRYFGPRARIVGLDVDPVAVEPARSSHVVVLGDQQDASLLVRVHEQYGPFDVVIDDGGHTMSEQIASAEILLPLLAEGGAYVVEDTHTSYRSEYGGSLGGSDTFMAWVKERLDDVHAYHWSLTTPPARFTDVVRAVHVYDSLVVLDAGDRPAPFAEVSGGSEFLSTPRQVAAAAAEAAALREALRADPPEWWSDMAVFAGRSFVESEESTLRRELAGLYEELESSWEQLRMMRNSASWRITAPLRRLRQRRGL